MLPTDVSGAACCSASARPVTPRPRSFNAISTSPDIIKPQHAWLVKVRGWEQRRIAYITTCTVATPKLFYQRLKRWTRWSRLCGSRYAAYSPSTARSHRCARRRGVLAARCAGQQRDRMRHVGVLMAGECSEASVPALTEDSLRAANQS